MYENVAWLFIGKRTVFKGCYSMVPSTAGEEGPPGHCWRVLVSTLNAPVWKTCLREGIEDLLFKIAGREMEDQEDII